jgi:protein TonB
VGSLFLHAAVILALAMFTLRAPTALMGGGGSSGMGGKRGEGGVATDEASKMGFSLRRLSSSPIAAADHEGPLASELVETSVSPTEAVVEKAATVPANLSRPADDIRRYLVTHPAHAADVVEIARTATPNDVPSTSTAVQPLGRQAGAALTIGTVAVEAQELRAAAGLGTGILGGTNGSGAGNGGGGRPGQGRGGGMGTGRGRGIGNLPTLASGNQAPLYPREAQLARQQGRVLLRVVVLKDGRAARVILEKSSGTNSLDDAALDAVKNWRFIPAKQLGSPVEATVIVPIRFRMREG